MTLKLRLVMAVFRIAWLVLMPLVLLYLWRRGRKDPLYSSKVLERFGFHRRRTVPHVWVHAVSLGELRSAEPIIRALLDQGESVVTTHFTPAGRREAMRRFEPEVDAGQLSAVWVPFDYGLAFRRFFRAFQPKFGLVMEVEFWPAMILTSKRQGVPLYLCNGQYPTRAFDRDRGRRISRLDWVGHFAGAMVKSKRQADRFTAIGVPKVAITGEMRFAQPIPLTQLAAGEQARSLAGSRAVVALTSVIEGEDAGFISAILALGDTAPFVVYVPRAPERFDEVYDLLTEAGLRVARRSVVLDSNLKVIVRQPCDVLLGDSLGEMYAYLAMADWAVVGGGFVPKGSHNIIEPLALGKPVVVGPHVWTIEYPVVEALEAGVAAQVGIEDLEQAIAAAPQVPEGAIAGFLDDHAGPVAKTLGALKQWGHG